MLQVTKIFLSSDVDNDDDDNNNNSSTNNNNIKWTHPG
jgi:hypothetical protein